MYVPTKILFGAGTLNELGKQQLPGKKAVGLSHGVNLLYCLPE